MKNCPRFYVKIAYPPKHAANGNSNKKGFYNIHAKMMDGEDGLKTLIDTYLPQYPGSVALVYELKEFRCAETPKYITTPASEIFKAEPADPAEAA